MGFLTSSVPLHREPSPHLAGRVPQIMQMEALECGAASLSMICAYYGKWLPLEQVRLDCGVSRDGSSALNLVKAARSYGFDARGFRFEPETLRERGMFPCIVHWDFNHFVVVRGFRGDKVYLNDPARGEVRISLEEFDERFTGVTLQFSPTSAFEPGGEPSSIKGFALERLRGSGPALLFVALTAMITAVIGAVNPVLAQIFTDRILDGGNPEWITPFAVGLAVVGIIQVLVLILNERYLLRLEGKMAVSANSGFMWKMLHLPMEFFSQRTAGDLQARAASNTQVASQLVGELAPLAINFIMLVFYLAVMISYSPLLAAIGLTSTVANLVLARVISAKRVNIVRVQMRDEANLAAATVTGIDMIETIKAAGAEEGYFQRWAGYQAGANNMQTSYTNLNVILGTLPQVLSSVAGIAVLMCGVMLVLDGSFTVGMILAFQGFLTQFNAPVQSLITTMQTFFEMRTDMERIQDVMEYPDDPLACDELYEPQDAPEGARADGSVHAGGAAAAVSGSGSAKASSGSAGVAPCADGAEGAADLAALDASGDGPLARAEALLAALDDEPGEYEKLRGDIRLEHVTFGYSRLAGPLIEDFSLRVPCGKSVAFVGGSGCGKSTLARLISGLYRPWSGEVLLDGKALADIPRPVRTGSVAVVDQDIVLFDCSIADNIRLWDPSIEDYEVILAARDAHVHDDIMERPGGYAEVLTGGGTSLSGGQRQRIEIARALACDPTVLVLDEATSALDAATERLVMERIRRRGITLVVVAHRLSTIRDCDEIVVLDHGRVVERGTHDELWAAGGAYAELVSQE